MIEVYCDGEHGCHRLHPSVPLILSKKWRKDLNATAMATYYRCPTNGNVLEVDLTKGLP
jgi:hypothetical protein